MAFIPAGESEARRKALLQNQQLESASANIIGGLKNIAQADIDARKAALLAQEKQAERIDKANAAEGLANAKYNADMREQEFNSFKLAEEMKYKRDEMKQKKDLADADNKAKIEAARISASSKPVKPTEEQSLASLEKETAVKSLASTNANILPIKNELDTFLQKAPTYTKDQLLTQGKQLIKTLNSTQGKDAVGAEEANRLAGKLDFTLGNFTNSNPTQFGRDLEGFVQQVRDTSEKIGGTIERNKATLGQYTGKGAVKAPIIPKSQVDIKNMSDAELEAFINGN